MSARPPRVLAVVGATATGKTALAESLADALEAEIVCADSRQVFRELEVGSGKPVPGERASRPHHLFDALELGQHASAGWYARAARETCAAIVARGRMALLVGGSGLYLEAAQHGLAAAPPHDPKIRARLHTEASSRGPEWLHRRLAAVDPASAARLSPRDRQRVSRALEVFEASGRPLSWWHAAEREPAIEGRWTMIEITCPPRVLAGRIAQRTRKMFETGLVEETRALLAAGHAEALRVLRVVGYDEAIELIAGRSNLEQAEERVNLRTRQLAKRQRTWFRHRARALSLDGGALDPDALVRAARELLAGAGAG